MNYDLVLCGVGGQGVLSIAWVIDHAAHEVGLHFKQSEVHGMAQRGGAVSAFVRLSDQPISSDLIADGAASLVVAIEPLEALRYTRLLSPDGWIATDVTPLINLDNYPDTNQLYKVLFSAPHLVAVDAMRLAQKAGSIKTQNMVVLGAAAAALPLPAALLEDKLHELFAPKGERIVKANVNAFRKGQAAYGFSTALTQRGISSDLVARVTSRINFHPHAVPNDQVNAWAAWLARDEGPADAMVLFGNDKGVAVEWVMASPENA